MADKADKAESLSEIDEKIAARRRRVEVARMGAYAMHSTHDSRELAGRAKATRRQRLAEQIDPTGELAGRDPDELERRIDATIAQEMARARAAKAERAQWRREARERERRQSELAARRQAAEEAARIAERRQELLEAVRRTPSHRLWRLGKLVTELRALDEFERRRTRVDRRRRKQL